MSRRLPDHPLQPNAVARWSHMSPASTRHMRQCCSNQLFYISEFAATQARESREAGRGAFGEARGGRGRCTRRRTVTRRARGGMSYPSSPTLRRSSSGSTARILPSVCRHQSNNSAFDNKMLGQAYSACSPRSLHPLNIPPARWHQLNSF